MTSYTMAAYAPIPQAFLLAKIADTFGTFSNSANKFPPAGYNHFFSPTAWVNRPLTNPTVDTNSAAYVSTVTTAASTAMFQDKDVGGSSSATDYEHPIYYATASDPTYSFDPSNSAYADTYSLRTSNGGPSFHMPTGCKPARGAGGSFNSGDNHVVVVDQTTGTCYCFWQAQTTYLNGGDPGSGFGIDDIGHRIGAHAIGIYSSFHNVGDARLPGGPGGANGDDANAAITNLFAGQIRGPELSANYIGHPLSVNMHLSSSGATYPAHVYPAQGNGSGSASWPPMGQFFNLALTSSAIEALSLPRWQLTILHAMADFGFYVDDTGANTGYAFDLRFECAQTYVAFGLQDPFSAYAAANPDATITAHGGDYYTYSLHNATFDNAVRNNLQAIDPTYIQNPH